MWTVVTLLAFSPLLVRAEDRIQAALTITWGNLDANHNNQLEKTEFTGAVFGSYDTNHNHAVTEAEFLAGWNRSYGHQEAAGRSVFAQVDTSGDKIWTNNELQGAYSNMDTSGDGEVSKSEFIEFASAVLKKANFNPGGGIIG